MSNPGTRSMDRKAARPIRLVRCFAASIAIIAGLFFAGGLVLAYWATHPIRLPVGTPPPDLDARDVAFRTKDGLLLSGWFVPRGDAVGTVVLCHGHQFHRELMLPIVKALRSEPFQFLLFDFRRSGRSEGDISGVGATEWKDVLAAVEWLETTGASRGQPIGVFGYSMGGAAAILAAARDRRIAAVATHGAYADLDSALRQRCRFLVGGLGPLLEYPVHLFGRRWLRVDPSSVSPARAIRDIAPRPVLLIHGRLDPFVPLEDATRLYGAAHPPVDLVILPHSGHTVTSPADGRRRDAVLRRFFRKAFARPAINGPAAPRSPRTGTE